MATTYKLCYASGFTWQQVVFASILFGVIVYLAGVAVNAVRGVHPKRLGVKRTAKLMAIGVVSWGTSAFYCSAMTVLPVSVAITLLFQFTWIGLVIQVMLERRAPHWTQVLASAVIVVGSIFASGAYQEDLLHSFSALGLGSALLAAVCCASFMTLSGRVETQVEPMQRGLAITSGTLVMSFICCPDFFVNGPAVFDVVRFGVILGVFGVFVPVLFFGLGTQHLSPGISTILASAELPAGLLISSLVLGEAVSTVQWLGVAAILTGVVISQLRRLRIGKA